MWPSSKALVRLVLKRKDLGSIPLQKGCGLWTPSCDFFHHFLPSLSNWNGVMESGGVIWNVECVLWDGMWNFV